MSILKIKDLTEQIRGVSYKPSDVVTSDIGLPILRANNIKDNSLSFDDLVFIKPEKVSKKQLLQNGDIVICASSGSKELVGKAGVFCNNDTYSFGAFCKAVRVNRIDGIDSDYVRLFFSSKYYRECIALSSKGSNINNIKTENIEELNINIPSIEEQNTAVSLLNALISAIDNKKQELFSLDELVKSRFIEMFENKDFPLSTIGNTCVLKSGTTFSKELEQSFGDILYIKVSDMNLIGNEKYITTSKTFVSKYIAGKTIIPANSVIFPKRGGAIGTNKKRINQCEICIDLNTMAVTPKTELNIQYLYQYFLNIDMGTLYNGSSVPQINNKDIEPLTIIMPPIELQNEFAEFVKLIDKSKFVCHSKNFLCDIFTFSSSTIAYPSVVSIFVCPKRC